MEKIKSFIDQCENCIINFLNSMQIITMMYLFKFSHLLTNPLSRRATAAAIKYPPIFLLHDSLSVLNLHSPFTPSFSMKYDEYTGYGRKHRMATMPFVTVTNFSPLHYHHYSYWSFIITCLATQYKATRGNISILL